MPDNACGDWWPELSAAARTTRPTTIFAGSPIGWRTLEQERLAPIDRERIDGHDDFTRRRLRFGDT